jgi:hypothetical protein
MNPSRIESSKEKPLKLFSFFFITQLHQIPFIPMVFALLMIFFVLCVIWYQKQTVPRMREWFTSGDNCCCYCFFFNIKKLRLQSSAMVMQTINKTSQTYSHMELLVKLESYNENKILKNYAWKTVKTHNESKQQVSLVKCLTA